jgi:hypothetical protein
VSILPVIERELRVAARKASTFRLRLASALVAITIGTGFLVIAGLGGMDTSSLGRGLFATLTWIVFGAALSAGLFFTADCLSEEKREGTIGFLFLTDLRGHDVVLGKLLATSLRGCYALLAVFPILAVTLLMGGVTGGQFWKTSLALLTALLVSLAAGLLVSSLSRDSQRALAGTIALLLFLTLGGVAVDSVTALVAGRDFSPWAALSSPGLLFLHASAWQSNQFWMSLTLNLAVVFVLLASASLLLPRIWQDQQVPTPASESLWSRAWRFGNARSRAAQRRRLLDINPVLWLGARERFAGWMFWVVGLLLSAALLVALLVRFHEVIWFLWSGFSGLLTIVLYLVLASQAAKGFVEARRNGVLELLLATPLPASSIVEGHWHALVRLFGGPLVLCLAVQFLGTSLAQLFVWDDLLAGGTGSVIVSSGTPGSGGGSDSFSAMRLLIPIASAVIGSVTLAANLLALAWFGMWMGLNSRSTALAMLKTILWVQVVPWFVISFASGILTSVLLFSGILTGQAGWTTNPQTIMIWFPLLSMAATTILVLAKDAAFVLWSRRKLSVEFRYRAAQIVGATPPPPLPGPPRLDPWLSR